MQETNLIEQEQPVGVLTTPAPAPAPTMTLCSYGTKLTREELSRVATPAATATAVLSCQDFRTSIRLSSPLDILAAWQ